MIEKFVSDLEEVKSRTDRMFRQARVLSFSKTRTVEVNNKPDIIYVEEISAELVDWSTTIVTELPLYTGVRVPRHLQLSIKTGDIVWFYFTGGDPTSSPVFAFSES